MNILFLITLFTSLSSFSQGASQFEFGKTLFESYRHKKIEEINKITDGYRLPSAPYSLLHPERTKYSVLLVHGLNDSPYYLKDIAEVLFYRGFNVITVLLPGHGLDFTEMNKITYLDWIREVNIGIRIASMLGENVTIGGFSTGGLLSINAALDSPSIKGLFLFAPAIKIKEAKYRVGNRTSALSCLATLGTNSRLSENPVKYNVISSNSICQLSKLIAFVYKKVGINFISPFANEAIKRIAQQITTPTFVANSMTDERLDSYSIMVFGYNVSGPRANLTFNDLRHSNIVLKTNEYNPQFNIHFKKVENHLNEFLKQYFLQR